MITFGIHDTYKVSHNKKNEKFSVDNKVLIRLYQPIIGSVATSLYLTLESELALSKSFKGANEFVRLIKLLSITEKQLNNAIDTLEKHGLLKIQQNAKKQNDFMFKIIKTKTAEEFLDDEKQRNQLITLVNEDYVTQVTNYFLVNSDIDDEYVDIDEVSLNKNYTIDEFFVEVFKKYPVLESMFLLDEKTKKEITRVKELFNLDYSSLEKAFLESSYTVDEITRLDFSKFNEAVANNNKPIIKSQDDQLISMFENEKAISFYQKQCGRKNLFPREIDMIGALLDEYQISDGIFNVVTDYCFKYKDMKQGCFNRNYFARVIESLIASNVKNTKDAINYFKNIKNNKYNNNQINENKPSNKVNEIVEEHNDLNEDDSVYDELRKLMGD